MCDDGFWGGFEELSGRVGGVEPCTDIMVSLVGVLMGVIALAMYVGYLFIPMDSVGAFQVMVLLLAQAVLLFIEFVAFFTWGLLHGGPLFLRLLCLGGEEFSCRGDGDKRNAWMATKDICILVVVVGCHVLIIVFTIILLIDITNVGMIGALMVMVVVRMVGVPFIVIVDILSRWSALWDGLGSLLHRRTGREVGRAYRPPEVRKPAKKKNVSADMQTTPPTTEAPLMTSDKTLIPAQDSNVRASAPTEEAASAPTLGGDTISEQVRRFSVTAKMRKKMKNILNVLEIAKADVRKLPDPDEEGEWLTLGEGGFGVVYKCRWLNREVAMKELRLTLKQDDIEKEVELVKLLAHPLVVTVFGYVQLTAKRIGIVMELMKSSLHDVIYSRENAGTLTTALRLHIAKQMIASIQFLHSRKVVHRDIKPANFLVSLDGKTVKISDFGSPRLPWHQRVPLALITRNHCSIQKINQQVPQS